MALCVAALAAGGGHLLACATFLLVGTNLPFMGVGGGGVKRSRKRRSMDRRFFTTSLFFLLLVGWTRDSSSPEEIR